MKQGEMATNIIAENTINLEQMSKKKKKKLHIKKWCLYYCFKLMVYSIKKTKIKNSFE